MNGHAWFYLHGLRRAVRNGKHAKCVTTGDRTSDLSNPFWFFRLLWRIETPDIINHTRPMHIYHRSAALTQCYFQDSFVHSTNKSKTYEKCLRMYDQAILALNPEEFDPLVMAILHQHLIHDGRSTIQDKLRQHRQFLEQGRPLKRVYIAGKVILSISKIFLERLLDNY